MLFGLLASACTRAPAPVDELRVEAPRLDVPAIVEAEPVLEPPPPRPRGPERDPIAMKHFDERTFAREDVPEWASETVVVPAFAIDVGVVTRARYDACVEGGGCPRVDTTRCKPAHDPDAPMTCTTMFEAQSYCEWVGKDLPTFDQWNIAKSSFAELPRDFWQWTIAHACSPLDPWCEAIGWTVAGLRETRLATYSADGPHARESGVGFRCVRADAVPTTAPHPGPCWTTCDGCEGRPDGLVDRRLVASWDDAGTLAAIVEIPIGTATSDAMREDFPAAFLDPARATARDRDDRIVAFDGRHFLTSDAAGNVLTRTSMEDDRVQYWQYHYACWDDASPSDPHPDVLACPRGVDEPVVAPDVQFGRCVAGERGRWSLAAEGVSRGRCGKRDECVGERIKASAALRYTLPDGTSFETKRKRFPIDSIHPLRRVPLVAFDYDGDGHDELVMSEIDGHVEDAGPTIGVWSFRGDAIATYEPAKTIEPESVADVDGDGRPDLLTRKFLGSPPTHMAGSTCDGGITSVFHSNADGTFTINDASTREHLAAQCERDAKTIFGRDGKEDGEIPRRLACMYLRGTTKKQLRARFDAAVAGSNPCDEEYGCSCDLEFYPSFIDGLPASAHGLLKTR